jgi:hypothetical protein
MSEIYVSVDIEMDGPIPGKYSMLSLGAAAFQADKQIVGTFSINFETLPHAITDPETMRWWQDYPEAWQEARKNPQPPAQAVESFNTWVRALPGKPVFVAYPAGSDFLFVQWYLYNFIGDSPFGYKALDMRSYAMAMLKQPFYQSGKKQMPSSWFDPLPHTHVALDDAISQGHLFCNMLQENLNIEQNEEGKNE